MKKPQVFLDYSPSSAKERQWMRTFVKTLTSQGAIVWKDDALLASDELWEDAMAKGLRQSEIVALIVTPDSIRLPNMYFELGAALGLGKPVVSIVSEGMTKSDIPYPLRLRRSLVRKAPEKTALEFLEVAVGERSSKQAV